MLTKVSIDEHGVPIVAKSLFKDPGSPDRVRGRQVGDDVIVALARAVEKPDQQAQQPPEAGAGEEAAAWLARIDADRHAGEDRQSEQGTAGARGFAIGSHRRPMAAAGGRFQPFRAQGP